MAECIGFDVVGLTAYARRRTAIITSGSTQVCLRHKSLKLRRYDRLLRRFECGLDDFSDVD